MIERIGFSLRVPASTICGVLISDGGEVRRDSMNTHRNVRVKMGIRGGTSGVSVLSHKERCSLNAKETYFFRSRPMSEYSST